MDIEQTILQAINDITTAESLVDEAKQLYCRARQSLGRIYAPAPKGAVISDALQEKIKTALLRSAKRRMKPKSNL